MWKCLSCGASTPKSCTCGRVNGEPAFPCETPNEIFSGLTMRDYFASKAMQGAISNFDVFDAITKVGREDGIERIQAIALFSFDLADAMLKAREGR